MLNLEKMDFEKLTEIQKGFIKGRLEEHIERVEEERKVTDLFQYDFVEEVTKIKDNMFIVKARSKVKSSDSKDEATYTGVVNGSKINYHSYTHEGAILLSLAYEQGDINAAKYMALVVGIEM